MCHPFVLFISGKFVADKKGYAEMYLPHLKYNLGRTITYTLMGAVAGLVGSISTFAGSMAGIQKTSAIIAGVFLVLYGVLSFFGYNLLNKVETKISVDKITSLMKKIQPKTALGSGLLLGLLPCGLVYGGLIASSASASPFKGALSMLLFGLGTSVAMMMTAFFGNFLMRRRGIFNLISICLLIIMGLWFIWQGYKF